MSSADASQTSPNGRKPQPNGRKPPRGLTRGKPEKRRGPRRSVLASRLTRAIFLSNVIGLIILALGSLAMGRFTEGLIEAKTESLKSTSATISTLLADSATGYGPAAKLDVQTAKSILRQVDIPDNLRVRLYDGSGLSLADSAQLIDDISVSQLDPIAEEIIPPTWQEVWKAKARTFTERSFKNLPWRVKRRDKLRWDMKGDVRAALNGEIIAGERYNAQDRLVVTTAQPIRRVQHVLGVIAFESLEVESIVNSERRALIPFIGLALLVTLLSSLALTLFIALPIRKLARAAEEVARSSRARDSIPDLSRRRDEIGDLSVTLNEMTQGLYGRVDDIANFAGDVAHEIKNPLTSLRSASDSLRGDCTKAQRAKLLDIIESDVARMDRLISDISKASKVDANLAKDTAETVDVAVILNNLAQFYNQSQTRNSVLFMADPSIEGPLLIRAFEAPFAQVFRNLIDNALTFSPEDGKVILRATARQENGHSYVVLSVEDEGAGIPDDNIEAIFERFYTERPKGSQFGSHSGLGLAICRQIVTAHKGYIYAENKTSEGGGTDNDKGGDISGAKFTIVLPRQSGNVSKRKKS